MTKDFINQVLEKAFLALVSWFLLSLVQDVKSMNQSIQKLNENMAIVINESGYSKERINKLETKVEWLQNNAVIRGRK